MTDPTDRPTHPEPDGPERGAMLRKQAWPGPPSGLTVTEHYADHTGTVKEATPADIVAHLLASPDDAWEVLELLAPKVAGPWYRRGRSYRQRRAHKVNQSLLAECAFYRTMGWRAVVLTSGQNRVATWDRAPEYFKRCSDARAWADAALLAAGYVLADGGSDER